MLVRGVMSFGVGSVGIPVVRFEFVMLGIGVSHVQSLPRQAAVRGGTFKCKSVSVSTRRMNKRARWIDDQRCSSLIDPIRATVGPSDSCDTSSLIAPCVPPGYRRLARSAMERSWGPPRRGSGVNAGRASSRFAPWGRPVVSSDGSTRCPYLARGTRLGAAIRAYSDTHCPNTSGSSFLSSSRKAVST